MMFAFRKSFSLKQSRVRGANREPIEVLETKILKAYLGILPPLDFDREIEIDQSCLEKRQRKHITRMRVDPLRMHRERASLFARSMTQMSHRKLAHSTPTDLVPYGVRTGSPRELGRVPPMQPS